MAAASPSTRSSLLACLPPSAGAPSTWGAPGEGAPPGDLDHARELDLTQLDRRARERAHNRGGVLRVDEQAHPGEHVAHLGALEERAPLAASGLCARGRIRRARRAGGRRSRDPGPRHTGRIRAHARREPDGRASWSAAGRGYAVGVDVIDWGTAQRVGELVAGSPPFGGVRSASVEPLTREFAGRVATYSGLTSFTELPMLELVDRPGWIAANLKSMRPLLAPITEPLEGGRGLFAGPMRSVSGLLMGVQVGALTGVLSQRVLGQYDLALLDATVSPRLLLLAPNLAQAARALGVDRDELVLWVSIHEITHAVQFTGAPWLREYLGGMLKELIEGLQVTISGGSSEGSSGNGAAEDATTGDSDSAASGRRGGWVPSMPKLPDAAELRDMVERARRGELLRLTLGEDRWALVERMQAAMSLIEGHAEHVMDAIGADVLPSLPRLRAAMNHRRENRGLPWRVLERLLGLELKMRQYETGRRFCDAVVDAGGPQALALAWSGPDALPTTAELEQPSLWIERVSNAPTPTSVTSE